jgi:catechol 2,3-dioxygenase-like lactoylglutathione lyase family enzyme
MPASLRAIQPVLMCRDVKVSVAFYRLLGFTLEFEDDPSAPRYAAMSRDGLEIHLQWHDKSECAHPQDRPTYRFVVDEVDELFSEFEAAGVLADGRSSRSPWARPGKTPWGTREFHVLDPDGNGLQFYCCL